MQRKSIYLVLLALIVVPLIINYTILRGQADTFISSSVAMSQGILVDGHLSAISYPIDTALPNWVWQSHTNSFIDFNLGGSGFIVAVLSISTALPSNVTAYFGVPYVVMILSIFLVYRCLHNLSIRNGCKKVFYFVAGLSIMSFICEVVIGRFYTLEYHAISLSLYMLLIFIFVKILCLGNEPKQKSSFLILIILIYTALSITHYNSPLKFIGGTVLISAYLTVFLYLAKKNNTLSKRTRNFFVTLPIIFSIILFTQSFYSYFLGTVNFSDVVQRLLVYPLEFYTTPFFVGGSTNALVQPLMFSAERTILLTFYTVMMVFFVAAVLITGLFKAKSGFIGKKLFLILMIAFIFGESVTAFLSYFTQLAGKNFSFGVTWLLNVVVILYLVSLSGGINKLNIGKRMHRKLSNKKIFLLSLVVIVTFSQFVACTIGSYNTATQGPLSTLPVHDSMPAVKYLIEFSDSNSVLTVAASHQVSTYEYMSLAVSDYHKLSTFVVANTYVNANPLMMAKTLNHYYNAFIITNYELNNGLHADVTQAYVSGDIIREVKNMLTEDYHCNIIYSSNSASILYLNP